MTGVSLTKNVFACNLSRTSQTLMLTAISDFTQNEILYFFDEISMFQEAKPDTEKSTESFGFFQSSKKKPKKANL